jgi:hypothetical protein
VIGERRVWELLGLVSGVLAELLVGPVSLQAARISIRSMRVEKDNRRFMFDTSGRL